MGTLVSGYQRHPYVHFIEGLSFITSTGLQNSDEVSVRKDFTGTSRLFSVSQTSSDYKNHLEKKKKKKNHLGNSKKFLRPKPYPRLVQSESLVRTQALVYLNASQAKPQLKN